MNPLPLQLTPGADLRISLESRAREAAVPGFVVSAVGNLERAVLRFPGRPEPTELRGELEIISLSGSLAPTGVHLSVAGSDGRVVGGHLENGSRVLRQAELLLLMLTHPAPPPRARASAEVEVAVLQGCPFSARAVRMLRTLGIPHTVRLVESEGDRRALRERSGSPSLPQVFIDGTPIGGYDALADLHGRGGLEALRPS